MGAAASIPLVAASAVFAVQSLRAAGIFAAGVPVGAAWGAHEPKAAANVDVVTDGLSSVFEAAETVMNYVRIAAMVYDNSKAFVNVCKDGDVKRVLNEASSTATDALRTAASSAFEKLKAAAAFVKDKVLTLVRHLLGGEKAAAASREVDRAAAADEDAGHDDVLSRASARVAGFVKALPPPPSSSAITVSATAPGGALAALLGSAAAPASRAAELAAKMMARLESVYATLRDSIPKYARSFISAVVAAVGIGLEATAAYA